jgi:hypothetical protein
VFLIPLEVAPPPGDFTFWPVLLQGTIVVILIPALVFAIRKRRSR